MINKRQSDSAIVSLRVMFFSPYVRERRKMIAQIKVLAARAPNHQISSPFCIWMIKATPVSIVQGSQEKA